MRVSLICTVLNEGDAIRRLLDSVHCQTRQPDEFIVVDGGSTDNTVSIILEYAPRLPLQVHVEPGANISLGRNVAIGRATGEIIASVDAGVWLERDWLEKLVAPIERGDGEGQTAAGFFVADSRGPFEAAMGATVLPELRDIDPEKFLPSSRSVAFTKTAWAAAGGYPEWLDYCEDLIFDLRLREVAGPFPFAGEAIAHFRPRGNLRSFYRQY
jgi:glycosyltransferase involved in cell wall biosynthesis